MQKLQLNKVAINYEDNEVIIKLNPLFKSEFINIKKLKIQNPIPI